jgi:hypothetical protein
MPKIPTAASNHEDEVNEVEQGIDDEKVNS